MRVREGEKEEALVPVMMMGRNTIWGKRRGREHNVLVRFRTLCCTNRNCNACDHGGYGANGRGCWRVGGHLSYHTWLSYNTIQIKPGLVCLGEKQAGRDERSPITIIIIANNNNK